jgi:hypothetical protein
MTMASKNAEITAAIDPSIFKDPVGLEIAMTARNPIMVAIQREAFTFSFKNGTERAVTKRVVENDKAVASAMGSAAKDQYKK